MASPMSLGACAGKVACRALGRCRGGEHVAVECFVDLARRMKAEPPLALVADDNSGDLVV